jgi:hypothetical protein
VEIQETIESLQGSLKIINDIVNDKEIFKNNSVFLHKQISAILLLEVLYIFINIHMYICIYVYIYIYLLEVHIYMLYLYLLLIVC